MAMMYLNVSDYWFVTLHERGAYLPGFRRAFGSTYMFSTVLTKNNVNQSLVGSFVLSRVDTTYLDGGGDHRCLEYQANTIEECVADYLGREVGCR